MIRSLIIVSAAVWLAACSGGASVDHSSPEAAAESRMSYRAAPFDLPSERSRPACPETMPTGGITGSPHDVAGPLFCDY